MEPPESAVMNVTTEPLTAIVIGAGFAASAWALPCGQCSCCFVTPSSTISRTGLCPVFTGEPRPLWARRISAGH